jgi:hypothetical protein
MDSACDRRSFLACVAGLGGALPFASRRQAARVEHAGFRGHRGRREARVPEVSLREPEHHRQHRRTPSGPTDLRLARRREVGAKFSITPPVTRE